VSTNPLSSTLYDILQVKPTASIEDIRLAFRELSKRYHPDTTQLPTETALRKFQQLNEAYATLSNVEQRRRYDQQLHQNKTTGFAKGMPAKGSPTVMAKPRVISNSSAYLEPGDRPLSAGEVFALVILAATFLACLLLAITLGLSREEPLLKLPSWQQPAAVEPVPQILPSRPAGMTDPPPNPLAPDLSLPPSMGIKGITGYHLETPSEPQPSEIPLEGDRPLAAVTLPPPSPASLSD
jgi:hypothetical protein